MSKNTNSHKDKFGPQAFRSIFVGYQVGPKGYKVYDINNCKVYILRDVVFHESVFLYHDVTTLWYSTALLIVQETDDNQPDIDKFPFSWWLWWAFFSWTDLNIGSRTSLSSMVLLTSDNTNLLKVTLGNEIDQLGQMILFLMLLNVI